MSKILDAKRALGMRAFCGLVLSSLVVLLIAACGDGEQVVGDASGRVGHFGQALSATTATVTISLPGGLQPAAVALAASGQLKIADRAKIEAGDRDLAGTAFGTVVSTGASSTLLGVSAIVGDVWSKPSVNLAQGARVEGDARSAGAITLGAGALVTGVTQAQQSLGPLKSRSFKVNLPASGSSVSVEPGQTKTLSPGSYAGALIKTSATLKVTGGAYYFDSMSFEPSSKLVLDDTEPVIFYVRGGFTWRGRAERKQDAAADKLKFLVVALGTGSMPIEKAFRGTVVAPNATLLLQPLAIGTAHWGAFFGKNVQVEADVVIHHHGFRWSTMLPADPVAWLDPVVSLDPVHGGAGGTGESTAETALETPVLFEVPDEIWVQRGNAGSGILTVSLRAPGQPVQTCTYHGGSTVAHPVTELDRAKGLRYLFPTCTGGIQPGGEYLVDWVRTEIVSADPESFGTSVSVRVGKGCDDTLPPPMTPEEVVATREDFDWLTTDALPEVDPEGNPALWHALIYVDNVVHGSADPPLMDQLQALDTWRVYYSALPLSRTYVRELAGKCGRVQHATDAKGVVVYAVLPAKLFNILRSFAIEAVLEGVAPPFKFIVPSTPKEPEFVNSDGSLKYAALGTSGYADWLAELPPHEPYWGESAVNKARDTYNDASDWVEDNVVDPVSEGGQEGFSYVTGGWDAAIDWTANATDDAWEEIQLGLAEFVGAFSAKVDLKLDFSFLNRDPNLNTSLSMKRLWGDRFRMTASGLTPELELIPRGARARVRQWGWGFLPVMSQSPIEYSTKDQNGNTVPPFYDKTTIRVLRDDDGRGDGALCVELDTQDGMLTTDLIPNEVCNFELGLDDIPTGTVAVETNDRDLHALIQIADSAAYAKEVMGYTPNKADVLIGWVPNELTGIINNFPNLRGSNERAMTLCLDFPSVGAGAISELTGALGAGASAAFGGAVGGVSGAILTKDIWWPDEKDAEDNVDSRGVMTHEYGHFLMCSMMYDHEHGSALTALIARLGEGQNDCRDDDITLATESVADAFTLQVVGGTNYVASAGSLEVRETRGTLPIQAKIAYCLSGPTGCFETNYRGGGDLTGTFQTPETWCGSAETCCEEHGDEDGDGLEDEPSVYPFNDELAKYQSIIHDAFDRSDSSGRLTLNPWNGDVFESLGGNPAKLVLATNPYIAFDDDDVVLPASMFRDWINHYSDQPGAGIDQSMIGLSMAMDDHGVSWCHRCELFALHERAASGTAADTTNPANDRAANLTERYQRWGLCRDSSRLSDIVGAPPEPFLNMNTSCQACGEWEFTDLTNNGLCTACPAGEVARGDHCEPCPPGSIPTAGNQCLSCGPQEISVAGQCVPCRMGEGADKSTNTCVECPADVVVDWNTVPMGLCSDTADFPIPANYGSVSPAGDVCPGELWYEVTHLERAVAHGGDSVEFWIDAAEPPEDELSCTQRYHKLEQFRYANSTDALWQMVGITELNGVWDETPPLFSDQCTWPGTTHTLGADVISGGLETVRFVARSLNTGVPTPLPAAAVFNVRSTHFSAEDCVPE